MTQESSLYDIFQSMDTCSDQNTKDVATLWAKKHADLFKVETYNKWSYSKTVKTEDWCEATSKKRGVLLRRFIDDLKQSRKVLVGALCYACYNNADSEAVVELFMNQLDYFGTLSYLVKDVDNTKCIVDVHVGGCDLPLLGQIVGPVLTAGYRLRVRLPRSSPLLPFFLVVADAVHKSGIPVGVYTVLDSEESVDDQHICIRNASPQYHCPVLVFEDSDIDSAVESIVQGAWRFSSGLTWSLTHVLVQESIYPSFVSKIKERVSKLKLGQKFGKCCDIVEAPTLAVKLEKTGRLEVYRPFESSLHRVYVGWDPAEYEASPLPHGLCVLPFRTLSEAIALVNRSLYGCAASAWTERISTINKLFEKLEVGTLWINSHGLLDPAIPFESLKETKYPINGKPLLCALMNCVVTLPSETTKLEQCDDTSCLGLHFVRSDIGSAVETARVAQKAWAALDGIKHYKKMYNLVAHLEQNYVSILPSGMISTLYHIVISARFVSPSFSQTVGDMIVTGTSKPFGIIWIKLSNSYALLTEQLIIIICASLVSGNAIIISAETDELKGVALHVCGMLKCEELPDGLLNIVTDLSMFNEGASNESIYCKAINRFITLGSMDAPSKCVSFMFGRNIELPIAGVDIFKSPELLHFLILQNKVMWTPNK